MAILSTILGGGIVGLPFAIYMLGLPLGIVLNLVVDYISYESGMLYMALRNLVPDNPNSLYEIGYILLGRKSIFLNALTCVVMSFCLILIYLIVISSTCASLISGFMHDSNGEFWYSQRYVYVLFIGFILTIVVIKKDLAELEWLATLLFISIGIFILMSLVLLLFDPRFSVETSAPNDLWLPKENA